MSEQESRCGTRAILADVWATRACLPPAQSRDWRGVARFWAHFLTSAFDSLFIVGCSGQLLKPNTIRFIILDNRSNVLFCWRSQKTKATYKFVDSRHLFSPKQSIVKRSWHIAHTCADIALTTFVQKHAYPDTAWRHNWLLPKYVAMRHKYSACYKWMLNTRCVFTVLVS